jgi:hypothetical protein
MIIRSYNPTCFLPLPTLGIWKPWSPHFPGHDHQRGRAFPVGLREPLFLMVFSLGERRRLG